VEKRRNPTLGSLGGLLADALTDLNRIRKKLGL
jgi:hypothetical protein